MEKTLTIVVDEQHWVTTRSRVARVRRVKGGWTLETCPEYPTGDVWERFYTVLGPSDEAKQHVLGKAIECHLKGWIKEWYEDG